jgi:UDP-galactose transporter B1
MKQYCIAIFISIGLFTFNFFKPARGSKADDKGANYFGLFLLLGSLIFDGMTGTQTDKQHKETKRDFAYPGMFVNNLVGFVLSAVIYLYGVFMNGDDSHRRIFSDQKLLLDCVMVGLTGSIGQVCIFFCISVFDCYLLSVITTTRKFFSVVFSNFKFGH